MTRLKYLSKAKQKVIRIVDKKVLLSDYQKSNVKFLLLQIPEHGNLGDQAITLAEEQWLEQLKLRYFEAPAELTDGVELKYAKASSNQIILVHGGGFLGSLWPVEEYRFRRILKAFQKQRIIVFPQTITFDMKTDEGRTFFKESKKVYTSNPNLTIFVRETKSLRFMREYMPTVDVRLVPDSVTTLDVQDNNFDRNGILLCLRSDKEKNISNEGTDAIYKLLSKKYPLERIAFTDTVVSHEIKKGHRQEEVERKFQEFAHSKLVITDRLHGMVFAALTGTPCIAIGNSNGKVRGVYQWIKDKNTYVKYVDDLRDFENVLTHLNLDEKYHYDKSDCIQNFQPVIELLSEENEQ